MDTLAKESKMGFARKLASPKNKSRERAISLLVTWLTSQTRIDDNEFKKIWKGLFYCVWHSDKAPVQADLIERLASVHEKLDTSLSLQFFRVFLMTMRREWAGIDRLRLDKFYLLLRKCLVHMLKVLERSGWDMGLVETFMETLLENAFLAKDQHAALGINLHYADIFFQELKALLPITVETLHRLLHPFLVVCANTSDKSLLQRIKENVFDHLFDLCRMAVMAKEGEESSKGPGIELSLGFMLLSLPLGPEAFTLASMPSTPQANRKLLYELHMEFETLQKLANVSSVGLPLLGNMEKKIKKRKKQKEALGQLCSDDELRKLERKRKKASVGVEKQDAEDRGAMVDLNAEAADREVLEEGNVSAPQSNAGELNAKLSKRKAADLQSGSEIQGKSSCKKKKAKEKSSVKVIKASVEDCMGALTQRSVSSLGTDESVISKLERQFDLLADEEDSIDPSIHTTTSCVIVSPSGSGRKKRKRATASDAAAAATDIILNGHGELVLPAIVGNGGTPTTANKQGNSSGKVKRVRFALKKNLVWTPSTPLPAESLRVPPSATPRGSALKKGILPGPIISETAMALKQRKGTPRRPATQSKTNKKRGNVVQSTKRMAVKKGRSI